MCYDTEWCFDNHGLTDFTEKNTMNILGKDVRNKKVISILSNFSAKKECRFELFVYIQYEIKKYDSNY